MFEHHGVIKACRASRCNKDVFKQHGVMKVCFEHHGEVSRHHGIMDAFLSRGRAGAGGRGGLNLFFVCFWPHKGKGTTRRFTIMIIFNVLFLIFNVYFLNLTGLITSYY